jgi:GNAT superfamily N-acetyltransferase
MGFEALCLDDESEEYIQPCRFTLMGTREKNTCLIRDPEDWERLGYVSTYHFLAAKAFNAGVDIWEDADAWNIDLGEAASVMYKEGLCNLDSECSSNPCNMLLIQSMWIDPKYRGKGLAEKMVRRAIFYHDTAYLAAVLIAPNATWEAGREYTERGLLAGIRKLRRMYSSWGFRTCPVHGNYMYLDGEHLNYKSPRPLCNWQGDAPSSFSK